MANISEAYGRIKITTDNKQDMELLNQTVFDAAKSWYYSTDFDYDPKGVKTEKDGTCSFQTTFWGQGRWAYQSNVECFPDWIDDYLHRQDKYRDKDLTKFLRENMGNLENMNFKIELEYSDVEPGCQVLYTAHEELIHRAGTPLKSMEYITHREEDYEWNVENLMRIGGQEFETACEYVGVEPTDERYDIVREKIAKGGGDLAFEMDSALADNKVKSERLEQVKPVVSLELDGHKDNMTKNNLSR